MSAPCSSIAFTREVAWKPKLSQSKPMSAALLDKNNDGHISAEELRLALAEAGIVMDETALKQLMLDSSCYVAHGKATEEPRLTRESFAVGLSAFIVYVCPLVVSQDCNAVPAYLPESPDQSCFYLQRVPPAEPTAASHATTMLISGRPDHHHFICI